MTDSTQDQKANLISKNDIATQDERPTAVTVKPVLAMIVAYSEGNKNQFKIEALKIARELELNGKIDLAFYIYAQFGLVSTFSPQEVNQL